jgi:hypothetical protein
MKSGIEIIVGVLLRKLVVKVKIDTLWVATLTPTAGDALTLLNHYLFQNGKLIGNGRLMYRLRVCF